MEPSEVFVQLRALQKEDGNLLVLQLGDLTAKDVPDLLSPLLFIKFGLNLEVYILRAHGPAVANDAHVVKDRRSLGPKVLTRF